MTNHDYDQVAKAAEYLDGLVGKFTWLPKNWREKINVENLSMSSCTDCILGQLQGSWDDATSILERHDSSSWDEVNGSFSAYTSAWKSYLTDYASGIIIGSKWKDRWSNDTMVIGSLFELDGKKYVAYVSNFGQSYAATVEAFKNGYSLIVEPKFQKGDILKGERGETRFIYVGGDNEIRELIRLGAGNGGDNTFGRCSIYFTEQNHGKLSKTGETFADKFRDLL